MQDDVNILIGVGGTGAKVVEAALVLMAAGVGPREVHVGLLDQDQSNGNVARTRELITTIGAFRKAWSEGKNYIDWKSDRSDAVGLGSIDVVPLFPAENNSLWCPEEKEASLGSILGPSIGGDPNRRDLFDLLFMRDREEQDLPLGKGYRGRAHVGATALVSAMIEDGSALLERLRVLMEDANRRKVNIFLVGSAFGGTGAAGFPTLARALDQMRQAKDFTNGANVTLGGILMLPYFSFNDAKTDSDAVVTSDELLPKAQLALDYYHNLFGSERAFDQFYALGWGNLFHLGYHEAGAAEQTNPALPPELFAASAALDFYSRAAMPGSQPDSTRTMVSARENLPIRWKDLPLSAEIEPKLGQFLRFSIYWRYIAEDMIDASSGILGMSKNWIQKLTNGEKKIDADREISSLRRLIDHVLVWAATLENMAGRQWSEGPWNMRDFVTENENSPTEPVSQIATLSESDALDGFDKLIRIDSGEFVARAGATLNRELKSGTIKLDNESRGLGRAVATVAKAASLRGER
jgi:hypothetical protein